MMPTNNGEFNDLCLLAAREQDVLEFAKDITKSYSPFGTPNTDYKILLAALGIVRYKLMRIMEDNHETKEI